jgi:aminoglycoside phosphotransferase (APT) family kinase protein
VSALAERLARLLEQVYGGATLDVRDLVRMSGGASRQTWSFDVVAGEQIEALVLRLASTSKAAGELMALEAAAMTEASRVGVPGPEIVTFDPDPAALGAPFIVMRRIDGETIPRRILRDNEYSEVRPRLAAQCGTILGALHSMEVEALQAAPDVDAMAGLRSLFDDADLVSPTLELAFRWLAGNRPPSGRRGVVHGDFRNGNLIVGPEGIRGVLDWELVHLGDPMEDLGWLCVRAWRFGGGGPVGGFGAHEDLFAAYHAASGHTVDPATVRWWEVYGTVRWGVICVLQASRHLTGGERSVELAAIGRRLCEQEYDCIGLLDELLAS